MMRFSRRRFLVAAGLAVAGGPLHRAAADERTPPVTAATFTPRGEGVVLGSQRGIEFRTWPGLDPRQRLDSWLPHVHDLAFTPDGNTLLAAGGFPAEGGILEAFSWPDGKLIFNEQLHEDLIYSIDLSADGRRLATASADGTCRVFSLRARLSGQAADAKPLTAAKTSDFEAAALEPVCAFTGHSRPVLAVRFLPGGGQAVSAGIDQTLRVWETESAGQIRSLHNHTKPVRALAPRPRTNPGALPMIASAGADRTVRFWQPTIGRMVRFARLEADPLAVAWTIDGERLLAGCADGTVRVIDPQTVRTVATHRVLDGWCYTLRVHPPGNDALVAGAGGKIRRLDLTEDR